MVNNITTDQVFSMLTGLVETGASFAKDIKDDVPMDALFGSARAEDNARGSYTDPMSRRNDVAGYQSTPYQQSNNVQPTTPPQSINPYTYGCGYTSDPVPYSNNNNSGYFGNSNSYVGPRRTNGGNIGNGNGTTSSSYGMGANVNRAPMQMTEQNPYKAAPYDERNYRFPDNGAKGGYGW